MEVSGQLHALVALSLGIKATGTHWIGGWLVPKCGLDAVAKSLPLLGIESRSSSP
jgi:hypothetical protein